MKKAIIFFTIICSHLLGISQANEIQGVINPSSDGIFIYNFFKPANKNIPNVNGAVKFRIERSVNKAAFVTLFEKSSPSNINEFETTLEQAKNKVPFPINFEKNYSKKLWLKYQKCNCFDSISTEIYYLEIQMAFAVLFKDEKVEKGKTYQYRVSEINASGNVVNSVTSVSISYPILSGFSKPLFYNKIEMRDNIRMKWYTINKSSANPPTAFKIYRKTDSEFTKLETTPFIQIKGDTIFYEIADDQVSEESYYYYYIKPSNYWGLEDVFSDTIETFTMPLGDILLPQFFKAIADSVNNAINLSFRVYKPSLVGSIQIWRSNKYDDGYVQIGSASSSDTGYIDYGIQPGMKHYYYLTLSDRLLRNSQKSSRVFGLYQTGERPLAVRNVSAIQTENETTIQWTSNDENITGFYVSRCQGVDGELKSISYFIPKTSSDSIMKFVDKDTLNPKYLYGYCVTQENTSYIQSICPTLAYVQPKDYKTIEKPINLEITESADGLMIFWEDMRDVNTNLAGYNIYIENATKELVKVNKDIIPSHFSYYKDTLAKPDFIYNYRVECVTISGKKSELSEVITYQLNAQTLQKVSGLTGIYIEDKVILSFNKSFDKRVTKYNIYRYERGQNPEMISELASTITEFEDLKIEKEKLYFYFVVALDKDGNTSKKSKEVGISIE